METDGGPIPVVEMYRGVGLHDMQPPARLAVVRGEIDRVFAMTDVRELFAFACSEQNSPEGRVCAGALVEAQHMQAAETRALRPAIDLDKLRAFTAGLSSRAWRSPSRYGTLRDRAAVLREQPIDTE